MHHPVTRTGVAPLPVIAISRLYGPLALLNHPDIALLREHTYVSTWGIVGPFRSGIGGAEYKIERPGEHLWLPGSFQFWAELPLSLPGGTRPEEPHESGSSGHLDRPSQATTGVGV